MAAAHARYKERIKASESLPNRLAFDRLQAFASRLATKMPRVREAFEQLEEVRELALSDSQPSLQDLDHETLSGFIVSMASKYSTTFTELRRFKIQDAVRQQEEKQSMVADIKHQEEALRLDKLILEAKEAMLERLRSAHRAEEEALALDRKKLSSIETKLDAERRKMLGLTDPGNRASGRGRVKRKGCHKTEPEEGVHVNQRLSALKQEGAAQGSKRIKLQKQKKMMELAQRGPGATLTKHR